MVVMIIIKDIKLDRVMQRNLLMATFCFTILVVFLFNLYWSPILFLVYSTYIIMNRDKKITRFEAVGFVFVFSFLIYCIVARMYGMGPGMFVGIIILVLALFISCIKVKGGKK